MFLCPRGRKEGMRWDSCQFFYSSSGAEKTLYDKLFMTVSLYTVTSYLSMNLKVLKDHNEFCNATYWNSIHLTVNSSLSLELCVSWI